jgi:hypothetical protein
MIGGLCERSTCRAVSAGACRRAVFDFPYGAVLLHGRWAAVTLMPVLVTVVLGCTNLSRHPRRRNRSTLRERSERG